MTTAQPTRPRAKKNAEGALSRYKEYFLAPSCLRHTQDAGRAANRLRPTQHKGCAFNGEEAAGAARNGEEGTPVAVHTVSMPPSPWYRLGPQLRENTPAACSEGALDGGDAHVPAAARNREQHRRPAST
jgi:hypothetical protein